MNRRLPILMLVAATAAWGLSFPGGKALLIAVEQALPGRDPWFFSALTLGARFALGAVLLALANPRAFVRMSPSKWRQGLGLGAAAGWGMLLQVDGLAFTEASTSAFLTQFTAVLVPLAVALQTRRLPSARVLLCVALVVAGCTVLARFDWHRFRLGRGEFETLLSTVFFAFQILWLDRPAFAGNHAGRVTLAMFLTIAVLLLPVAIAHCQHLSDLAVIVSSWPIAGLTVAITLACSIFAFRMMNHWQPRIDPTTAGIIYCAEPLFATLFARFLPAWLSAWTGVVYANENFTAHLVGGATLITIANILIARQPAAPHPVKVAPAIAAV